MHATVTGMTEEKVDKVPGERLPPWYQARAAARASVMPGVPGRLRATLVILALYAQDMDGRGMYPSWATLARSMGVSVNTAGRNLEELERLGFIRRGDQKLTHRLPPGRRPIVYDLATAPIEEVEEDESPKRAVRPKKLTPDDYGPVGGPMRGDLYQRIISRMRRDPKYMPDDEVVRRMSNAQFDRYTPLTEIAE
jgi:DNA-binding transcriptional MocR family regulator